MKLDTHGIRFRFWIVFFLFAVGIILFIGALQVGFIRPYYRDSKVNSVQFVADEIEVALLSDKTTSSNLSSAIRHTVNNSACVVILNDAGNPVYTADSIGAGCILNRPYIDEVKEIVSIDQFNRIISTERNDFSKNITNPVTGQEMIIYGRKITKIMSNYYILVNSALEPVDSIVTVFSRQYSLYMILAIIGASLIALYISQKVTKPIVKMNNEASKLAKADYSAKFDGGSFTETTELAVTLNTANEKLSKIDELRRDLMANVSHDIRTPITNIKAYAEMIKDISGDNPEKRDKHLDVIIQETDYMNRLVNDMTELSMMQSGNYVLNRSIFNLSSKIDEIVSVLQPLLVESKISIKKESPKKLMVYADEVKIGQVLANYITNAVKYTPFNNTIIIRAFKKDIHTVRFEVIDVGIGIKEEDIPYIWDRYQKVSKSFSRSQTSTGLGLSIVKGIADAHHAKYGVETEEGKGSTFYFELIEEKHE